MKRVRRLLTAALVVGVPWINASVPAFASDRPPQPAQVQILVHLDISTKQQMNAPNKVVLIGRHGSITTLADSTNGTENPTTVLIRGRDIYVANGAYHTGVDPNLMLIQLNQGNG